MKKRCFLLILTTLFAHLSLADSAKRETLRGYFILEKNTLYFTEKFHTTYPVYRVEWWNEKDRPSCMVNLIPSCKTQVLSFERQLVYKGDKNEIVFSHAILDSTLKKIESEMNEKKD